MGANLMVTETNRHPKLDVRSRNSWQLPEIKLAPPGQYPLEPSAN